MLAIRIALSLEWLPVGGGGGGNHGGSVPSTKPHSAATVSQTFGLATVWDLWSA